MNLNGCWPEFIQECTYRAAKEWVAETLLRYPEVRSIYEYGHLNHPGISDIDLIVVIDGDGSACPKGRRFEFEKYPQEFELLLKHNYIKIVTEQQLVDIQKLGAIDLNLVGGVAQPIASLSMDDKLLVTVCDILDWLPERVFALENVRRSTTMSIVDGLGHLKSMCLSLQRVAMLGSPRTRELEAYKDEVSTLRARWFDRAQSDNLAFMDRMLKMGVEWGGVAMMEVDRILVSKGFVRQSTAHEIIDFRLNDMWILRLGRADARVDEVSGMLCLDVPAVWRTYMQCLSNYNNLFGKEVRNRMLQNVIFDHDAISYSLKTMIDARVALISDMAKFCCERGVVRHLYRAGHLFSKNT